MNALLIPVPPERIRSRCTFDDEGIYTIYNGKWCSACAVVLTSRNRYRDTLLCIEHGKEKERERYQRTIAAANGDEGVGKVSESVSPKIGASDRLKAPVRKKCPERQNLKRIFHLWLNNPDQKQHFDSLRCAMNDYELRTRLRKVLIPSPQPAAHSRQEGPQ